MFKSLCQNYEIGAFLEHFPNHHWKKIIEALCIFGVREIKKLDMPLNLKTIEEILNPVQDSNELQQTLSFMKHELKHLSSAIKRIERKTQSSADLFKDMRKIDPVKIPKQAPEIKPRNSSSSGCSNKQPIKTTERSYTPNYISFNKIIQEPRVCPLNDAQEIIKQINSPRVHKTENNEISSELLKSKASNSTQDTFPKYYLKAPVGKKPKKS